MEISTQTWSWGGAVMEAYTGLTWLRAWWSGRWRCQGSLPRYSSSFLSIFCLPFMLAHVRCAP